VRTITRTLPPARRQRLQMPIELRGARPRCARDRVRADRQQCGEDDEQRAQRPRLDDAAQ
jgi:hypothetical protein